MIIKIQVAQFPKNADVLVYNKDRSLMETIPFTKEIKKAMKGEPKKYFEAKREKDAVLGGYWLNIVKEVEAQDW